MVLLQDLDRAPDRGAPVTLDVVRAEKGARALARADQEQAEFDVIQHGQAQRLVAAAFP